MGVGGSKKGKARDVRADAYTHDDAKRKNNPEAGMIDVAAKSDPKGKKTEYCWDPRESPQLVWAGKAGLKKVEVEEQTSLEVPLVNLHIHERVSAEAIIRSAQRQDAQRSLFADTDLGGAKDLQYYQHDVDWSNRMILGDSLLVMNSLVEREGMRGKVQCIYMDPPYGIKFGSNFQPKIDQRDVKDGKDDDLTREVMQVQAFRDTWELGVHSYLSYLRDRLLLSRELLADSGSIFVQIGDENDHRVRCLMDEVFGEDNHVATIGFQKTSSATSSYVPSTYDSLIWYAKEKSALKFRQVYLLKSHVTQGAGEYVYFQDGQKGITRFAPEDYLDPERAAKALRIDNLTSQSGGDTTRVRYSFKGRDFTPGSGGWKTNEQGLRRLDTASRLHIRATSLNYVRYLADFPVLPLSNFWEDTAIAGWGEDKQYVVQTARRVAERCILMTTDPGDLVLDPTCGSGTTAYIAEQWGRRWITMDTSRVALAIARHRLMTASYDYYKLRHPTTGVSGGFRYKTVPHVTLKSIAQNPEIDKIAEEFQPKIDAALADVNRAFGKDWKEWEVPRNEAGDEQ